MNAQPTMQIGLAGRFRLVARSEARGEREVAEFDNLILDAGLNRIGTNFSINSVQVGTGTTTPAVGQTGLAAWLVGTSASTTAPGFSYVAGPPEYTQFTYAWRFTAGQATGNLAEVGVG